MTVNETVRQQVRERAKGLCEYCHSPEQICTTRFTIDHILPRSLNGSDHLNNLAFACRRCNERRYNFVAGYDHITETIVSLFNPRQQQWSDHFIWSADGKEILGTTPIGRATCDRLDLNDTRYPEEESIRSARELWKRVGLHPPKTDPSQSA
ncbi:HNH endonuclease [Coleofasciculus sp. F4-SAH-05]|uniref:HNH endonuclease n=1 Tax=Coleofasciculus sp. F4-SAH-05 TaxID=3069525 RepID=UPI0032F3CDB9